MLLSFNFVVQCAVTVPFFHVFLKGAVHTKRHLTDFTFVNVLAHLPVAFSCAVLACCSERRHNCKAHTYKASHPCGFAGALSDLLAVFEYFTAVLAGVTAPAIFSSWADQDPRGVACLPPLPVPLRPETPPSRSPGGVEKRRLPFSEECSEDEAKGDCLESPKFRKGSFSCREAA